jgi:hypothetical protein
MPQPKDLEAPQALTDKEWLAKQRQEIAIAFELHFNKQRFTHETQKGH